MMNQEKIRNKYLKTAINLDNNILDKIFISSNFNRINSELLFAIVVIEKMNRGHFSNYIFEKILSILYPSLLIKTDASIGLCQIRLSAAKKVSNLSPKNIVRKLMCPYYNIDIMAKLINLYTEDDFVGYESIEGILNLHITAKAQVQNNIYLSAYYDLVNWSINKKKYSILYSNNKNVGSFK